MALHGVSVNTAYTHGNAADLYGFALGGGETEFYIAGGAFVNVAVGPYAAGCNQVDAVVVFNEVKAVKRHIDYFDFAVEGVVASAFEGPYERERTAAGDGKSVCRYGNLDCRIAGRGGEGAVERAWIFQGGLHIECADDGAAVIGQLHALAPSCLVGGKLENAVGTYGYVAAFRVEAEAGEGEFFGKYVAHICLAKVTRGRRYAEAGVADVDMVGKNTLGAHDFGTLAGNHCRTGHAKVGRTLAVGKKFVGFCIAVFDEKLARGFGEVDERDVEFGRKLLHLPAKVH